jgi:hypothetical protein
MRVSVHGPLEELVALSPIPPLRTPPAPNGVIDHIMGRYVGGPIGGTPHCALTPRAVPHCASPGSPTEGLPSYISLDGFAHKTAIPERGLGWPSRGLSKT